MLVFKTRKALQVNFTAGLFLSDVRPFFGRANALMITFAYFPIKADSSWNTILKNF
jgi:hypothetical protein